MIFHLCSSTDWIKAGHCSFLLIWNPRERLSEADSPAWTGRPAGDRILIWDPVWAWWSSAAIVPPTPAHRSTIKSLDPCLSLWVSDRATERKRKTQMVYVHRFYAWEVVRKHACICVQFVWFPVVLNARKGDWCRQPQGGGLWLSGSNGQSRAESNAKWTAFSPEISHHMSFFENIHNFATTWLHGGLSNSSVESAKHNLDFSL